MDHYVGIEVSLELSSLCVLDASGRIVREAKVASEPEALIGFLSALALPLARIGLEAGPLSQWLHAALVQAGFAAVLLETRHVKAALSAMIVKTDPRDARGIAPLLRVGWVRSVHCKSPPAQEVRALLVARKQLQRCGMWSSACAGSCAASGSRSARSKASSPLVCARWSAATRCWSGWPRRCGRRAGLSG